MQCFLQIPLKEIDFYEVGLQAFSCLPIASHPGRAAVHRLNADFRGGEID